MQLRLSIVETIAMQHSDAWRRMTLHPILIVRGCCVHPYTLKLQPMVPKVSSKKKSEGGDDEIFN